MNAVQILFNPRMPEAELFAAQEALPKVRTFSEEHFWIATSGSTAASPDEVKWVALSRSALLASAAAVNQHLVSDSRDVWVHVLPEFHVGGLGIRMRASLSGARVVGIDGRWDARAFYERCSAEGATLSALVPAQVHDLVAAELRAPSSMRAIVVGGGALSEALYLRACSLGWPVLPSYGMSECCSQIATAVPGRGPEMRLLSHVTVRTDNDGRLEIRSPALFSGYAYVNTHSRTARFDDPRVEGWFRSEDRGEASSRGELKVHGRTADFVKVGGESVDLARLQSLLSRICAETGAPEPALTLVAMPDERLGHVIHGVFESAHEPAARRAFELYDSRVMPFERLRKVRSVASFPRSALGKLLRGELIRLLSRA